MREPSSSIRKAPSVCTMRFIGGSSPCWVKGCQTGEVHAVLSWKEEERNGRERRVASRSGVSGSSGGSRPRTCTLPIAAMIRCVSVTSSPMKAMPKTGMERLRSASSDSSV